jgi:phage terminase large subunit
MLAFPDPPIEEPVIADVEIPPKLVPVFDVPRGAVQYRALYGGRGSAKSRTAAKIAAVWGYVERLRILTTREFQASIKESFYAELKAAIDSEPWLAATYDVGENYIVNTRTGTEFLFKGLRHNINTVRSLSGIDLTIVEEAEDVPEVSWLTLEATVFRQPKSELWALWNPRLQGSPVDKMFRVNPPSNAIITEINHHDNIFFPATLEKLRLRQREILDPNMYAHIWEGAYLENSEAQVFAGKWHVEDFEISPDWDGPYQGGDFGFSQDPTAVVRVYIDGETLYISHEAGKIGLELDDTGKFICDRIEDFDRVTTRWDNARPESISHIKKPERSKPLPRSISVDKWKGSVEDGIAFLRSFKRIVVHSRCKETQNEMRRYSYKVDRLTQDVTADIVDAFNHYIDALRYAVTPIIKRSKLNLRNLSR